MKLRGTLLELPERFAREDDLLMVISWWVRRVCGLLAVEGGRLLIGGIEYGWDKLEAR